MSVYHMTFTLLYHQTQLSDLGLTRIVVKEPVFKLFEQILANTPHTYLFILARDQWESWKEIVKTYGWEKYITYEMPYFVRNPNYKPPDYPEPRLRLVILKGQGTDALN